GYQHVNRPLKRKRRHKASYMLLYPRRGRKHAGHAELEDAEWRQSLPARMAALADRFGAQPMTRGNVIHFYHQGRPAFDAMLEAIRGAKHHVHLETCIFRPDATGAAFLEALAERARQGVKVRLLYDAMGSHQLWHRHLATLLDAGGLSSVFLPLNLFRRRLQINMRNHRKIMVVDGDVGFLGGLNIGDEDLGKHPRVGSWR